MKKQTKKNEPVNRLVKRADASSVKKALLQNGTVSSFSDKPNVINQKRLKA